MKVALVLRSGGEYHAGHVARLAVQIREHLPAAEIICLSDVEVPVARVPLRHGWPGWWSKLELFAPWIKGDVLFMDLDSAVVGDLESFVEVGRLAIMRDVYRPNGLQSSIMYLPEGDRAGIWREWMKQPEIWMQFHRKGGDQAFLERHWLRAAARWQDILPGQLVSWKVHCAPTGRVPEGARIIIFHGKPRPWEVGW